MTDRLRVALGSIYPYDESRIRGGVEAVALYLTHALAKRDDLELHVVSCNHTAGRSFVERRDTVTFHWLATGLRFYLLRAATIDAWRVRQVYHEICPQVIHAQGFTEYAVAAGSKARTVLTIHGVEALVPHMWTTARYKGLVGRYRRWVGAWVARQSIRKASAIMETSGGYASRLLGARLDGKPIYKIANPVAGDFFSIEQSEEAAHCPPMVLWAGEISERKNLIGLMRAFAVVASRLPEARLMLTGDIAETKYFHRVQAMIAERRLEGKVKIAGRIPHAELLQAYARAAIIVMSSVEETAPMTLAQAMAAGKPVVATPVGGIPWMVEDGVTGYLVDVGDTQGLASRMLDLLLDEPKRKQMGLAAKGKAQELFAPDVVAERTVQAYRELLRLDKE